MWTFVRRANGQAGGRRSDFACPREDDPGSTAYPAERSAYGRSARANPGVSVVGGQRLGGRFVNLGTLLLGQRGE